MTLLQLTQNKLNSINNSIVSIIASNVDEETGEISEDVIEQLDKLQLSKDEITKVAGISYHQYKMLGEQVAAEKKRLYDLEKSYKSSMESFKRILEKILDGDTYECENFKVSYRKSTSLDLDDGVDIIEVPTQFQRVKIELDKTALKEHLKTTGTLPNGVIQKENKNMVIKWTYSKSY